MKPMNDKSMKMKKGAPMSEGFFPEGAHVKKLAKPGEISRRDYPDTEQDIIMDQNSSIKDISRALPEKGFRH